MRIRKAAVAPGRKRIVVLHRDAYRASADQGRCVVTTVHLNLLFTLLSSLAVLSAGRLLVLRTAFLRRFSIPVPVVGGVVVAVALALADLLLHVRVSFDMGLRDILLLMFFTTVGLSADAGMLLNGGPKLLIFLAISAAFIAVQNLVGIATALALDLHPLVGLLGGSITLTGGHGTGAAYGGRFGETMNLAGSMELTMACATAGLVAGSLLGGPLAEYLIAKYRLTPSAPAAEEAIQAEAERVDPVTTQSVLDVLFMILGCLAFGKLIAAWVAGTGVIVPDFLFCLLIGVAIRNTSRWIPLFRLSASTVDLLGGVALSMFLVMALMGMRLIDLASLAGPLLVILIVQVVAMALYAVLVTFRAMGRDYDAAVLAAGHVGFALSSTAAALAVMKAVTGRRGPAPIAFVIVPMVGAFFIDIANAVMIQIYLALPLFGFPS
jgi:ESS family glutamate:Na+ symporter